VPPGRAWELVAENEADTGYNLVDHHTDSATSLTAAGEMGGGVGGGIGIVSGEEPFDDPERLRSARNWAMVYRYGEVLSEVFGKRH
jgi:hypothetical protein